MMKNILPAPSDELLGFVPFYPHTCTRGLDNIAIVICGRYIRLSQTAAEALSLPEYVVVFLDRIKRRIMITPGTEKDRNALKLSAMPRSPIGTLIYSDSLRNDIVTMTGKKDLASAVCPGHSADTTQPAIIFHLDDIESKRVK